MIKLLQMDDLFFESFKSRSINEYAQKMVANGLCDQADAYSASVSSFEKLIPNGKHTQCHSFQTVALVDETVVGGVWSMTSNSKLMILDIFVEPLFRRRGIAKSVIGLLENESNRIGLTEIQLHVFGDNFNAISLYSMLGFQNASIRMRKILQPA